MARHRHAVNVRVDGLARVLGPIASDPAVQAALLVDVDSGMVLDACRGVRSGDPQRPGTDPEELGAAHGELMRLALGAATGGEVARPGIAEAECEVLVSRAGRHLVMRRIADPHGERLALSVLVDGPPRALRRVRRRLDEVSASALTAGPSVTLRPVHGAWVPATVEERPPVPAPRQGGGWGDVTAGVRIAPQQPGAPAPAPSRAPALATLDSGLSVASRPVVRQLANGPGRTPVAADGRPLRVVPEPATAESVRPPAPPSALPPPALPAG